MRQPATPFSDGLKLCAAKRGTPRPQKAGNCAGGGKADDGAGCAVQTA
ncbi:hypothetical protein [Kingella potus]|nr:hypothetical protein [Kingella potus]UOP01143.1 hypothetical protein LVJ84_02130 [Kingella potus]